MDEEQVDSKTQASEAAPADSGRVVLRSNLDAHSITRNAITSVQSFTAAHQPSPIVSVFHNLKVTASPASLLSHSNHNICALHCIHSAVVYLPRSHPTYRHPPMTTRPYLSTWPSYISRTSFPKAICKTCFATFAAAAKTDAMLS